MHLKHIFKQQTGLLSTLQPQTNRVAMGLALEGNAPWYCNPDLKQLDLAEAFGQRVLEEELLLLPPHHLQTKSMQETKCWEL